MKTFVIGDTHGRRRQLNSLLQMLPRGREDTLVLLGDLIDRGEDVPGTVGDLIKLQRESPERTIVLRGNHEQMLLDLFDGHSDLWFHSAVGSEQTFEQYAGRELSAAIRENFDASVRAVKKIIPPEHIEFFRQMPLFYEDEHAIYVHAGLDPTLHPRDTPPQQLLWTRNLNFFKNYHGKPCVFGHTPTQFLPVLGRLGRHGIYISGSAIGIDTGYTQNAALTCLELPSFTLRQAFADGHTVTHHISAFVPEALRALRRTANLKGNLKANLDNESHEKENTIDVK